MERGKRKKIDAVDLFVGGVMRGVKSSGWLNFAESCSCQACLTVLQPLAELRIYLFKPVQTLQAADAPQVLHVNLPRLFPLLQLIDSLNLSALAPQFSYSPECCPSGGISL
jgi:hypothetical protein